MTALDTLKDTLPDFAKDARLNLSMVLESGPLSESQRWCVAVACAIAIRNTSLRAAIVETAKSKIDQNALEDAQAAAVLMGINNTIYKFRHMVGKESYSQKPARLRMNRLMQLKANKIDFELCCLAVSAINGCETCVKAHEKVVIEAGSTEDQVFDAIRIAANLQAVAIGLEANS